MKKNLIFLCSFSLAKGIVFLAPILLADILSERDFGVLEYALAGVGMLLNAVLDLGVSGAYPYFILRQQRSDIKNGFNLHPLWLLLAFLSNQFLYFGLHLYEIEMYMAINISYIIANQVFYSTQLKSHEKPIKAVFLDAGVYIVLLFFIVGYGLKIIEPSIQNINKGVSTYALLYAVYAIYNYLKNNKETLFSKYAEILQFSIHLLISSFFLFSLTVAGRILSKEFFGFEATALYGFYYRISAVVVMIYQVISIRYFKEIYTLKPTTLDAKFSLFYVFIFVLSILIFVIAPFILPYFSNFFATTYQANKALWFIIFSQMTMWIATALHSNIVDREGLAKKNNILFLALFLATLLVLFFTKEKLSLLSLTFLLHTVFFVTNILQIATLYTKKIIFKKVVISLSLIYVSSIVITYFLIE